MKRDLTIGVDIGGTKTQTGLVSANGRILKRERILTRKRGSADDFVDDLTRAIKAVWSPRVRSIGVGIAGLVDTKNGIFISGPNLPTSLKNLPLAARLKRRFKVPVRVDNDARCFTLGETRFGSAKGRSNVVALTIGTGIGGGLVVNGQVHRGHDNSAGEVGHMTLGDTAFICGCGRPGHLEALASGTAISERYRRLTGRKLPARDIDERSRRGDRAAVKAVEEAGRWLGLGIANLALTLDPDVVVIGGGAGRTKLLWPALRRSYRRAVLYPKLRNLPIVPAKLGDDASLVGAAQLA